jgi:hypothetical protein
MTTPATSSSSTNGPVANVGVSLPDDALPRPEHRQRYRPEHWPGSAGMWFGPRSTG